MRYTARRGPCVSSHHAPFPADHPSRWKHWPLTQLATLWKQSRPVSLEPAASTSPGNRTTTFRNRDKQILRLHRGLFPGLQQPSPVPVRLHAPWARTGPAGRGLAMVKELG